MNERIHNLLTLCMEAKAHFEYWPNVGEIDIYVLIQSGGYKASYVIRLNDNEEFVNRTITEAENYLKEVIGNASI